MGKRIVITSFGSLGDIYPYLALARQLTKRGHEAIVATSAYYRPLIEKEGVAFCPVRPDIDPEDRGMIRRVMEPKHGPEILIRECLLPHLRDSYADLTAAAHGADLLGDAPDHLRRPRSSPNGTRSPGCLRCWLPCHSFRCTICRSSRPCHGLHRFTGGDQG